VKVESSWVSNTRHKNSEMSVFFLSIMITFMSCVVVLAGEKTSTTELDIHCMIPSWYRASSPIKNESEGGYAGVHNPPQSWIGESPESGPVFVDISGVEAPFMNIFKGFRFRIVNQTDHVIAFQGVDSILPVILQAFVSGEWKPIQFQATSHCGNSYHVLYLPAKSFWNLTAPIFHGQIHTILRLRAELLNGKIIYSPEFHGSINKEQIIRNDTLIPINIWDQINLAIAGPMEDLPEPEIPIITNDKQDVAVGDPYYIPPPGKKSP
jgi:hypothetical protein